MTKRKKVLFCITKSVFGGAQKYIYDLALHLPPDAFESVLVAGGSGPLFYMFEKKGLRAIVVRGLDRDVSLFNELRAFGNLVSIFITEKPDIIHLNSSKMGSMGAIAAWCAKLLTFNFKSRMIFTVHGWGFREDRNIAQQMAIFAISWISSLFHNHTITINSADHKDATAFIPKKKLSLVPLGITASDTLSRNDARAFLGKLATQSIDEHTFLCGTIAELTKNKGLAYLLESLHHLVRASSQKLNIHCVIIGEGEERKFLEKKIHALGLESYVTLTGFITDAHRYLPAFDLFTLTSVKEGLPYALMEAMATEIPVIATHVGGVPDLISHGVNGFLIEPKKPEHLKNHLEKIIRAEYDLPSLAQHAKQTIASRYSLDAMIKKTTHLYHELT